MIRYLNNNEKQICRELWREAFPEDSEEFDDYYFKDKVKDNRILALFDESERGNQPEKIDAMIHLNPYTLMVRGRCWQADYLVGVATRKEKRHRGYMRCLLLQAMKDMRRQQMPFCFLMPADEAIYTPFGFTYIYRQMGFVRGKGWKKQKAGQAEIMLEAAELKTGSFQEVKQLISQKESKDYLKQLEETAKWMNCWLDRHYQVYAKRDEAYLERLIDELISENGTLDILCQGDKIMAMESWWGRKEREQRLLYGDSPYVETTDDPGKPAIMARIISPEVLVQAVHLRENTDGIDSCVIPVYIQDPLIEENHGLWKWHLNQETSWLEKVDKENRGEGESSREDSRRKNYQGQTAPEKEKILQQLSLKIDEMTAWLFGYQVPEAVRPYENLIDTLQDIFLDEIV